MKKATVVYSILGLMLYSSLTLADSDWRLWNTETVQGNITQKLSAAIQAEFRWKNDMGDFYYNHDDISLTYGLLKWLDITPSYREVYTKKSSGWVDTHEPNIGATVKWDWADFKFSNQFRYAYKDPSDASGYGEFRDHFRIVTPWKFTGLEINPFIGDYVYYHGNTSKWDENRFYAGVSFNIYGPLKGSLYYLLQSVETDDKWSNYNTLGTALNCKF